MSERTTVTTVLMCDRCKVVSPKVETEVLQGSWRAF